MRVIGMSANLQFKPLDNIGLNGLNLQGNPSALDPSWLTKADNIVLRESGRISFRKGLKQNVLANTDGAASAPLLIGSLVEHKDGSTNKVFAGVGTKVYTVDFTSPDTPWTGSFTAGTASDWQFVNFNKGLYGFQTGNPPIKYTSSTWAVTTTKPAGVTTFDPSCGMGYYGRNWVGGISEEKDVMYYTDTLQGDNWTTGAYGSIDLKTVWGTDEIVAIAPFYGKLVIFGKHNVVIYNNPDDPGSSGTMQLDEVIRGVGCASRDTVVAVGDDLLFLSDTGLRSLNRTSEVDKLPLTEYSVNVKDTLIRNISQSSNVKSVYVENEGIYTMSFPDLNITYVFDMKHLTPNKSPRITTWHFDSDREPTSMAYTESKGFLLGQRVGSVATYEGYFDKKYNSGGTYTTYSYTGTFLTTWLDLGDSTLAALLKKLKAVINGGSGTVVGLKWYKDFNVVPSKTLSFQLNPVTTGTTSLFGASSSLYGATTATHTHVAATHPASSTYAPVYGLKEYQLNLTGSAKFLQIEMSAETKGFVASLQTLTLLFKQGKTR
jgi:hypothetical protein